MEGGDEEGGERGMKEVCEGVCVIGEWVGAGREEEKGAGTSVIGMDEGRCVSVW